jgi:glycosyltransferase involved in cell wall biosynthesis
MYQRANAIIAVTHSFKNELVERGIDPKKIFVVTNGVDITRFFPKPKNEALLNKLELKDKFVVGYIGTLGMAHRLETLLEVADLIQRNPKLIHIHLIFIGDGAERDKLKVLSTKRNLKNVSFLNSVSKTEICDYWSILDLSVVHLKNDDLFNTVIPSKIFESMAMGIPILHSVKGESANIIVQTGSGILAEAENAESIYNVLRKICFDKFTLDQMARNGKNAAKGYNRRSLALKMIEIFKLTCDVNKKL